MVLLNNIIARNIITRPIYYQDWTIYIAPYWEDKITDIAHFWRAMNSASKIKCHNDKSSLSTFTFKEQSLVVKNPTQKDRNLWQRIISPIRDSEAKRDFTNSLDLLSKNLPVAEPVLYSERRKYGFLIESRFVATRIFGKVCSNPNRYMLLDSLSKLHSFGFVHGDPHIYNFLCTDQKAFILDLSKIKKSNNALLKAIDLALLEKSTPGILPDYQPFIFKIANFLVQSARRYRETKRKIMMFLIKVFSNKN